MSGPQGSDPRQPWQPPGQGADHSSDPTVAAGYPLAAAGEGVEGRNVKRCTKNAKAFHDKCEKHDVVGLLPGQTPSDNRTSGPL
ncbi:hypothetical protein ABLN73_15430, partial [Mycobacterium tuberculosis]